MDPLLRLSYECTIQYILAQEMNDKKSSNSASNYSDPLLGGPDGSAARSSKSSATLRQVADVLSVSVGGIITLTLNIQPFIGYQPNRW